MQLCRQKRPSLQQNMLQQPAEKAEKRLIWTNDNLFIIYHNLYLLRVGKPKTSETFLRLALSFLVLNLLRKISFKIEKFVIFRR